MAKISSIVRTAAGALLALWQVGWQASSAESILIERSAEAGLVFEHRNGSAGLMLLPEIVGPGSALFDYDNDGDLDLYLVQSGPLHGGDAGDQLFRNELVESPDGQLRFSNVTSAAGIKATGYGMGVATGDVDNDGWTDLYITNFGANQLWVNRGDGTFEERAAAAGVDDSGWSTSAVFLDFDRDGRLDLYVANYVTTSLTDGPDCFAMSSAPDYCGPDAYPAAGDRLYRNVGEGRFVDASRLVSPQRPGAGLGAVALDANGDGWPDLFVANDGDPNWLWMNQGGKAFEEQGMFNGVAVNGDGIAEASMGVALGDVDGNGAPDLFLTHLDGETNTLYLNDGSGLFADATQRSGLAAPSLPFTGFGTGWLDLDNDGWLDLFVANGAVRLQTRVASANRLVQSNQLFRNLGSGRFADISESAGSAFVGPLVSRGAAAGDVNNDGRTDLVINNNDGPVQLFLNSNGSGNHWIGVELATTPGSATAIGATIVVTAGDGRRHRHTVTTGGSYCSANDPRRVFGLGRATAESLLVRWPDGAEQRLDQPPIDRYHRVRRQEQDED